ncbi:MAG: Ig-like domain-containing protein [Elusimicrobiales bacterium]
MGNVTNIVVGMQSEGTLKIAAQGAQESSAADAGYIKGGIAIAHDENRYAVKVDQALGAVDMVPTDEKMTVKLSLAEATLSNMALAFGYPDGGGGFSFGSKEGAQYRTLYINVKGPGGSLRKYTFWKCSPTGKTSQAYKLDSETVVDVEFDVLCDTAHPAAQRFGCVSDSGADSTPPAAALTVPAPGGGVAAGTKNPLTITFTEAGLMDEGSLRYGIAPDATVMALYGSAPAALVAGALSYCAQSKTLSFTPAANWSAGSYMLVLTTGVKDAAGNRLAAPYFANFTAA